MPLPPPPLLIGAGYSEILQGAEEEDSFFELDIALPQSDDNKCTASVVEQVKLNSGVSADTNDGRHEVGIFHQSVISASPGEKSFSKRKVLPIEGLHRPQSPISLLNSAPRLRVFMFAESNSTADTAKEEAGKKQGRNRGSPLLALKFKEMEIRPFFSRSGSLRKREKEPVNDKKRGLCSDYPWAPKTFSWDLIQKYLRLVKLFTLRPRRSRATARQSHWNSLLLLLLHRPPLLCWRGAGSLRWDRGLNG